MFNEIRIYDKRATGKTTKLAKFCKENNAILIGEFKTLGTHYGLPIEQCMSYDEFLDGKLPRGQKFVINDLHLLVEHIYTKRLGYDTNEDAYNYCGYCIATQTAAEFCEENELN